MIDRPLLAALALVAACASDPDPTDANDGTDGAEGTDGTDGADGTDGSDGTADGTDGTTAATGEPLELHIRDLMSGADVVDAVLTVDGEDVLVDETGRVTLRAEAGAVVEASGAADGYPPFGFLHPVVEGGGQAWLDLPHNNTLSILSSELGVTPDPERGIVALTVFADDGDAFIAGTTVGLDVAWDEVLVMDESQAFGITTGDTTVEGSASTVIFVNVEAGTVTPSFLHEQGLDCSFGPETLDVRGGVFLVASWFCVFQ